MTEDMLMHRIRAHRSAPDVYDPPTFEEMAERIEKLEKAYDAWAGIAERYKSITEKYQDRCETFEELVMDIVADCREGHRGYEIEARIAEVMQKLDGDK